MLIARRNLMGGKPLPYLRRVEYIASDGNQNINMGFVPTSSTNVIIKFRQTGNFNGFIFGQRQSAPSLTARLTDATNMAIYFSSDTYNVAIVDGASTDYILDKQAKTLTNVVSGSVTHLNVTGKVTYTDYLYLFSAYASGRQRIAKARIYSCEFGGDKRIKLIPVLDLSGRPCLYDEATTEVSADDPSRYYYNQGTGEFTWSELGK